MNEIKTKSCPVVFIVNNYLPYYVMLKSVIVWSKIWVTSLRSCITVKWREDRTKSRDKRFVTSNFQSYDSCNKVTFHLMSWTGKWIALFRSGENWILLLGNRVDCRVWVVVQGGRGCLRTVNLVADQLRPARDWCAESAGPEEGGTGGGNSRRRGKGGLDLR